LFLHPPAICLERWHTFALPLEWNLATYTLVGRQLLEGKRLYLDVRDIKPPATLSCMHDLLLVRGGFEGPGNHPIWRSLMEHCRPLPYDGRRYPSLFRFARQESDLLNRAGDSRL